MSFPSPIKRVDQYHLAHSGHQIEFHLSWNRSGSSHGHFVSHESDIQEPRRKRGFFRRISMSLRSLTAKKTRSISLKNHQDDSISMTSLSLSEKCRTSTNSLKNLFQKISPSKWKGSRETSMFSLHSQDSIIQEVPDQASSLPYILDIPSPTRRRPKSKLGSLELSKIRRFRTVPDLQSSGISNDFFNQSRGWKSTPRRKSPRSVGPTWKTFCASVGDLGSNTSGSTDSIDYYVMNGRQIRCRRRSPSVLPPKYQFQNTYEPKRYQIPRHRPSQGKLISSNSIKLQVQQFVKQIVIFQRLLTST